MSGDVEIFNQALSACGVEVGVASPDENSREAAACRLWYPRVRDNVLASAPWASVRKHARLARIAERNPAQPWSAGNPEPDYTYAYATPADLLRPYHLTTYGRFGYGLVNDMRAISTNDPEPLLYYNARLTDVSLWGNNLRMAIVHTLATYLVMPLAGNMQRFEMNAVVAQNLVEEAQAESANERHEPEDTLPEWLQVRGYGNSLTRRYYYPMQTLAIGSPK